MVQEQFSRNMNRTTGDTTDMKHKLLIVDDELANLRLLERLFSQEYHCLTASSGADAIRLLEEHDVALLLTDQRMPGMTGIELLKRTATLRPHMVRILLTGYTDVEALVEAINCGLVYFYFTKPWNNEELKLKVIRAREHYENNRKRNSLTLTNDRLTQRMAEMKSGIVLSLSEMLTTRDAVASEHALRVRNCAAAIGEKLGLEPEEKGELAAAALLHDLGQLGIENRLLAPCGANTVVGRSHADCEARLLFSFPELESVADMVRSQRENFDGSGGPRGLKGQQIPLSSRIIRIADEYDLIRRPKAAVAAMTHEETMSFLSQRSGKQFDPEIIDVLQQLDPESMSDDFYDLQIPVTDMRGYRAFVGRLETSFVEPIVS